MAYCIFDDRISLDKYNINYINIFHYRKNECAFAVIHISEFKDYRQFSKQITDI